MEESLYSGKAHTHTNKVQYTVNIHGLIIHKTTHSPGRINDITVYKARHPTFRVVPPAKGESTGTTDGDKDVKLRHYMDRGYQGAQSEDAGTHVVLPIRKKPKQKLTDTQKEYNTTQSRVRVYVEHAIHRVKTFKIMGHRYRNPLRKYDLANSIVCGLVNRRTLVRIAAMA